MDQERDVASPSRIGWLVFAALAVLTVVEYVAAIGLGKNVPVLVGFAVLKAGLIGRYFMHILALLRGSEEGH